ncbi:hypothetical protein RD792_001236 [Penstemon davidsonii]|uniref:Bifunctional inhibitor/plant lipid transfer protein/seed storage helical domain-containing protein n=1 Tax=Penstemon davidsonii TaxID=160366 RepID=A0ABR0DMU1_9LAMI|nr:hypothetical protein RD792_001236 [Penstemon davidsonii]
MKKSCLANMALLVVLLLEMQDIAAAAVNCSPSELSWACIGPLMIERKPSPLCCAKLKEQQHCFCGYLRDPSVTFIHSPDFKMDAAACGVTMPHC